MTRLTQEGFSDSLSCTIAALTPKLERSWRERIDSAAVAKAVFEGRQSLATDEITASFEATEPDSTARRLIQRALVLAALRELPDTEQSDLDALALVERLSLDDPMLMPTVQRTPFGFIALRLFASELSKRHIGELIRIHVWEADGRPPLQSKDTLIHSHELSARSWIVAGSISNENYEVCLTDDASSPHALYSIQRDRHETSTIVNTGMHVNCRLTDRATHGRGETYEVPLGGYHCTDVDPAEYTATLFYFGNQPGWKQSYTVGPASATEFGTEHVRDYDDARSTAALQELLERL